VVFEFGLFIALVMVQVAESEKAAKEPPQTLSDTELQSLLVGLPNLSERSTDYARAWHLVYQHSKHPLLIEHWVTSANIDLIYWQKPSTNSVDVTLFDMIVKNVLSALDIITADTSPTDWTFAMMKGVST
jgi:hypothetical protein